MVIHGMIEGGIDRELERILEVAGLFLNGIFYDTKIKLIGDHLFKCFLASQGNEVQGDGTSAATHIIWNLINKRQSLIGHIVAFILVVATIPIIMLAFRNKRKRIALEPITVKNIVKRRLKVKKTTEIIPGNAQHIGCREEQQDAFGFSDIGDEELVKRSGVLALLADGMGGMAMGYEVGNVAVQTMLEQYPLMSIEKNIPEALKASARMASEAVYNMASYAGVQGNAGSTLVAAVIHKGGLYWMSVGDSRIYLYRKRYMEQLNVEHTYAEELEQQVRKGEITREEADAHPDRHTLTSYIGLQSLDKIECSNCPLILEYGDKVLLCSDGLYGTLGHDEIADILDAHPQKAAEKLIEKALTKRMPYQDNVTAVILSYE